MQDVEAIEFLRKWVPESEEALIGFSGGKDSVVTAHLCKRAQIKYRLCYTFTGIDPPEVVQFVKTSYPETLILRPALSFWHGIQTRNPPLPGYRWCCTQIKKAPSWKLTHVWRVMGIRKEESPKRAKYGRVNVIDAKAQRPFQVQLYPIYDWREDVLWDYIDSERLQVPDLYEQGLSRIGCVVCPFHNEGEHAFYRKRWPFYFKTFEKCVDKWFYKRVAQGRDMKHGSPQEFLVDWYRKKAQWYEKKR